MTDTGIKPVVLIATLVGGAAAGVLLATPRGRQWLQRKLESARDWMEYSGEDLGELLEARVERTAALRRAGAGPQGAQAREVDEHLVVARVREALAREPRVHARQIRVLFIGGVVHLEGAVATLEEKETAGDVAQQAARTHILVNDLHVSS